MMPNPLSTPMPAVPGVLQYGDVANLKGENGKFLSSTKGTCTLDAPGRSEEADFGLVHISKGEDYHGEVKSGDLVALRSPTTGRFLARAAHVQKSLGQSHRSLAAIADIQELCRETGACFFFFVFFIVFPPKLLANVFLVQLLPRWLLCTVAYAASRTLPLASVAR